MAEKLVNFKKFYKQQLKPLEAGDTAFHAQLYPKVYPPDQTMHELLTDMLARRIPEIETALPSEISDGLDTYRHQIHRLRIGGVDVSRLRSLPDVYTSDVPGMIKAAELVSGRFLETVRVTRFRTQLLGHLAASGVDRNIIAPLQESADTVVPRKGFWSIRPKHPGSGSDLIVGMMDYELSHGEPTLPGVDLQLDPDDYTRHYVNAVQEVFDSSDLSAPLTDWEQLYS